MGWPNIPIIGQDLQHELTLTQYVIPAGSGATFSNANSATLSAGGITTITFNGAHGLTMTPSANVPANLFIGFGGSTSAATGTGILVGNIFKILTIPSTTAITIWTTISTMTVTSLTGIPVFFPPFLQGPVVWNYSPTQTISSVVTAEGAALGGYSMFTALLGANASVHVNVDQTFVPLDPSTGNTPATAPTWRSLAAASTNGQYTGAYPWMAVYADGTTATSYLQCHA
jgi:hypothetical protein